MGIEIIGKLTQKNNGDFKLVDLADVDYDGTGKSAKQELENKIEEAKNSLTPYDDSAIKADINNIKTDLGTEELTTTSKKLKGAINELGSQIKDIKNVKADKSTTDNIQQQVNNLVLGAVGDGNNAEVVQARGNFALLDDRLNKTDNDIKSLFDDEAVDISQEEYTLQEGKFYNKESKKIETYSQYNCIIVNCEGVKKYIVTSKIWSSDTKACLVAFLDSNDTLVTWEGNGVDSTQVYTNKEVVVPQNAKKMIVTFISTFTYIVKKCINKISITKDLLSNDLSTSIEKVNKMNILNDSFIDKLSIYPFGTIKKGAVVFCDDDGLIGSVNTTIPLVKSKNIPINFCVWADSALINSVDRVNEFKNLMTKYNCGLSVHYQGSFVGKTQEWLRNYFDTEKSKFKNLGLSFPKTLVYGDNLCDSTLRFVCRDYFSLCAGGGYKINKNHENIYNMNRIAVQTTGYTLDSYKNYINQSINDDRILILYFHGNDITSNTDLYDLLVSVIDYAKSSNANITTLEKLLDL